jgi:hypothetical protein
VAVRASETTENATLDHHLARLDAGACRAFVADLWAARGFETRIEDDVVVARRRDDAVTIVPACGGRIRGPAAPSRDVDVVVAPRGGDAAAAIAADHDARLLVAADLRGMLRYAVDPADAEALCERHLGAAPSALRPSALTRTRRHLARVGEIESPVGLPTVAAILALVVLASGGIAAFGTGGPPGDMASTPDAAGDADLGPPDTGGEFDGADGRTPTPDNGVSMAGSRSADVGSLSSVPGVDRSGVTNVTALALAHDRALGDRSYTLWLDTYRPFEGVPGEPWTQRDTDIAVEGDRYLVRESLEQSDDRWLVRAVYFDGTDWYVDDRTTDQPSIRWIDGTVADVSVQPDPRSLRETLVTRYLATPTTRVTERVDVGESTRYRLEGEGRPPAFAVDRVHNYSFVAFVDESGLVHEATVEFTVATIRGTYRLRFEWTYGGFDATTVREPAWTDRAQPANRTETAHIGHWGHPLGRSSS